MAKNQITTKNPEQTKGFARALLKEWLEINKDKNSSWLVCLYGDLGGGKTTFAQGLAEELGVKETVASPTFVIMKKYVSSGHRRRTSACSPSMANTKKYILYHFDCYRISSYRDIIDLGWEDIISGKNNIIVVEWPEKIKEILPNGGLNIEFEFIDGRSRRIRIVNRKP